MKKRIHFPNLFYVLLAGILLAAAPKAHATWNQMLPDTLLPGTDNYFYLSAGGISAPTDGKDTVQLRGNGQAFNMIFGGAEDGVPNYNLALPYQAKAGWYDIYRGKTLLERQVAWVDDIAAMTPAITGLSGVQGSRGHTFTLRISGSGLPFGPIPATGTFTPSLNNPRLERSGKVIPLILHPGANPYAQDFGLTIPASADTGAYDVVLERKDGVQTRKTGGFRVFIPPAPLIGKAVPDTLHQMNGGTIALIGTDLQYGISQGSFLVLDQSYVKEVFLRKDSVVLKASSYNFTLTDLETPYYQTLQAQFAPSLNMPLGSYDVGLVLYDRPDTSFLMKGVKVLGPGTPALVSVSPAKGGLNSFDATVKSEYLKDNLGLATITLRKGATLVTATVSYGAEDVAEVHFPMTRSMDTGRYDLQAVLGTTVLRMPGAVQILPPEIGPLSPAGLRAGQKGNFEFEMLYPDFDLTLQSRSDSEGLSFSIPNLRRTGLCRGTDCLEGEPAGMGYGYGGFTTVFSPPASQPPGLYDLEATSYSPDRTLRKKNAVLIAPPGFAPLAPWDPRMSEGYFPLRVDSLFSLSLPNYPPCTAASYQLNKDQAPTGLAYSQGALSWRPAAVDTGWHFLALTPTGNCSEGFYLALRVDAKPGTAVRPQEAKASEGLRTAILGISGTEFRIRLDKPSQLEVRSLDGRRLAAYGDLPEGSHTLAIPAGAKAHGLLLLRIRQAGGDSWLRMMR